MNFYEHLDASTLLSWCIKDKVNALRASVAMLRVNWYVAAARLQMTRIWDSLERAREGGSDWSSAQQQAFVDMHFYFVCWDAVGKMMRVIGDCSGFAAASDVYDRHRDTIERYREARNHLEHFDERLPGGKRVGQLAIPSDLGNLSDGVYSFGGKSWDVTPSSLAILEEIVDEFNSEIRSESIARHRAERESTS